MRTVGRIVLWLFLGLVGSAVIGAFGLMVIEIQSNPKLPYGLEVQTSFWDRGYVRAKGTWVIEDSSQAFPRQTTEIKCYREEKECISAQAEIAIGDTLYLHTERMPISTWDDNVVVYSENESLCVTYVYTITRASERVTGTRRPKQSERETCKEYLEQRTLNLTLRDGFQVWRDLNQKTAHGIYPYMWAVLALWWVFVIHRLFRKRRPTAAIANSV